MSAKDELAETMRKVQEQYGGLMAPKVHGVRTGAKFQDELDDTHRVMMMRKWGAVYRHESRTAGAPGNPKKGTPGTLRFKRGGNPVDYSGHINIRKMWNGIPLPIVVPPTPHVGKWESCGPNEPGCFRLPIVFDAKREGAGDTYHNKSDGGISQLLQLREARDNGAAGFLLVHLVKHSSVFIIERPAMLDVLLRGGTVQLVEKGSGTHLVPSARYQPGHGWPYAALVPVALGW